MKSICLYIKDNDIMSLEDIKNWYAEVNNSSLPILDSEMELIILTDLKDKVKVINDDIIRWVKKYAKLNQVDRYFSKEEMYESTKLIYQAIKDKDNIILPEIKKIVNQATEGKDEDFIKLKEELNKIENNGYKVNRKKRSGR